MSSIQERLQLKRGPLDSWNLREQLCLASAVVRSGDQNWMSVSRALKTIGEPNRPPDWYSQKSCAAQYGALLEHVETPKRKKRSSEGAVESPQESIVKRLTQERIAEIQKSVAELNQQHEQVKNEISEIRNQSTSEERLRELWAAIESAKRAKERETARRAAMLKEREERRARANTFRPPTTAPTSPAGAPAPPPPSSPLLTSLLKSSPVVTTPQHMPHPASVVDTMSPSVNAPTLSMLLEKGSPQQEREKTVECNKHAAIEHIKSQLVQIEQQLKAGSPPLPAPAAVEIDDIEIKAEDVYAFRDVDLHLPVATMHKGARPSEKSPVKKEEPMEVDTGPEVKVEQITVEEVDQEVTVDVESETVEVEETIVEEVPVQEESPTSPVQATTTPLAPAGPQFKFPTTEIKVIQPIKEEIKVKEEEPKQPEVQPEPEPKVTPEVNPPEPEVVEEIVEEEAIVDVMEEEEEIRQELPQIEEVMQQIEQQVMRQLVQLVRPDEPDHQLVDQPVDQQVDQPIEQLVDQTVDQTADQPVDQPVVQPVVQPVDQLVDQPVDQLIEEVALEEVIVPEIRDIPLPPEPETQKEDVETPPPPSPEPETPAPEPQPEQKVAQEDIPEVSEAEVSVDATSHESVEEIKKDEDSEDSIPLKQMLVSEGAADRPEGGGERHQETDDDTPMEVSREEDKDGKKRRDYSRKKKPDSRTCSGSESAAEASAPESPSSSDDRQHRLWKKSVMLVYNRLCAHKYASLFVRPITDEEAPGYSVVVKRPMDLTAIRRNIDNGVIRSTCEFQRDVLLMLSNALLYNSSEHSVYTMAREMHEEAISELSILLAAQAHAGLESPPRRRRRRRDEPRQHIKKI